MQRLYSYSDRKPLHPAYSDTPYSLQYNDWPHSMKRAFDEYRRWRIEPFRLDRPRGLQQRPITFDTSVNLFECFFGYLVNIRGMPPDNLAFDMVSAPDLLHDYASWHANERLGYASRILQIAIRTFLVAARDYLQVDTPTVEQITQIAGAIDPKRIHSIDAKWVSLAELDAIGRAEWPTGKHSMMTALTAQRSLLLRLLVRRPLRRRNMCEMKLGHNLIQNNGQWYIVFRGDEMKIESDDRREKIYKTVFPADLVPQLDEFIEDWRPFIDKGKTNCLFITHWGRPFSGDAMNAQLRKMVYEYTGKAMNIHTIRHVWASELIIRTNDFALAAQMLGDKIETVIRNYAHLSNSDFGEVADTHLAEMLKLDSEGDPGV